MTRSTADNTAAARTADTVRRIWSQPSCILAIFAGSSAEFAVNPEAEWLFYTGRLPADPIGRFVGTMHYTRKLIFAATVADHAATVRQIRGLHTALEKQRQRSIPTAAYIDVLLMNIEYSVRAFRLVYGCPLSEFDRDAVVEEFRRVGELMDLPMPRDWMEYEVLREQRLASFKVTEWTPRLLQSYRRALGPVRFFLLGIVYRAVADPRVLEILDLKQGFLSRALETVYPCLCKTPIERWLIRVGLPARLVQGLDG